MGTYKKPLIDCLGHAKLSYYANRMIFQKVVAGSKEEIERVVTKLDGRRLGDDRLAPAEVQYQRVFEQAGAAGQSGQGQSAGGLRPVGSLVSLLPQEPRN